MHFNKVSLVIENNSAFPSIAVRLVNKDGITEVDSATLFAKGRHVLFALPGAFTGTCSELHLPGYVMAADELKANGIERIVCLTVNDPAVVKAWGEASNAMDTVEFIADGNADLTKALGIDRDLSVAAMGTRAARSAFVIKDGIVEAAFTEHKPGVVTSSGAPAIIEFLKV